MSDLVEHGALELAALVRSRKASAREVVQAHVDRLEAVQPRLNALALPRYDQALEEAARCDEAIGRGDEVGPLAGVPITIKESFDVAGMQTTAGVESRVGDLAAADSHYVARLRKAGAIVVGKTNVAQLLFYMESDNPVYGRTANPWDPARTPGGSSGGEAAAIAARGSPLGLGSDIGGSVRGPAHFCGIASLKPTTGRLDTGGTIEELILHGQEAILSQAGPMARRVDDLELALEILSDGGDPRLRFSRASTLLEGLRIGWYDDDGHVRPCPAARRAVKEATGVLEARGAVVVPFTPPGVSDAYGLYLALMTADGGASLRRMLRGSRVDVRNRLLLLSIGRTRAFRAVFAALVGVFGQRHAAIALRRGGAVSVDAYWRLVAERTAYRRRFLAALDEARIDVLVCPPLPTPAFLHRTWTEASPAMSYCSVFNVLGLPAGVLPATRVAAGEESDRPRIADLSERALARIEQGSTGLPIGVQVASRPWREDLVLTVMRALEEEFRGNSGLDARPELI
jgi:Asp-tRNA(Asn)/Glu-tRNA(Gln) amidotransferase A subunit family amidase